MANNVIIENYDEIYIRILAEPSILYNIQSKFTFDVPGARYMPSYRNKTWDGKIRLLNVMSGLIYKGLLPYIEKYLLDQNYTYTKFNEDKNLSLEEIKCIFDKIKITQDIVPRQYQIDAYNHGLINNRSLFLLPTSSGKSLIIYLISQSYEGKILIIVPTTGLVHQMVNDFVNYGCKENDIHKVFSGQEKNTNAKITITTWQSIHRLNKKWFEEFNVVIGDEAHLFKASSLTTIMTKLNKCKYRFGFTGTIDGSLTNTMVLEGLFGKIYSPTTTKELMDAGYVSELKIKSIVLNFLPSTISSLSSVIGISAFNKARFCLSII